MISHRTRSKCFLPNAPDPVEATRYPLRTRRTKVVATAFVTLAAAAASTQFVASGLAAPSSPGRKATGSRKRRPVVVSPEPLTPPRKKRGPPAKKFSPKVIRTKSFSALWSGSESFPADDESLQGIVPHTLILGTHPSVVSLDHQQYFRHPMKYVCSLPVL
jgi:hypothetical protein